MKAHQNRMHIIHLIDSIYLGQLNSSYQKDGFGIQQTFQFDTYIGYWRNNKTQGLGLVVLANAIIIYANFNRDSIDGLTIVDNGDILLCGIYRNHEMVGVGFQYNHQLKLWKMQRYHKGFAIQVIKQQYHQIGTGLPKIINVQQSIYFHLYNYVNKKFFPNLQQQIKIINEISPGCFFYGYKNQKGAYGPGVCINRFHIVQGGFYEEDELHGFGFKKTFNPSSYDFGCFHKGRKDGPFMEKDQKQVRYAEYRKNILMKNLPQSEALIYKNQKRYNFNCKDFLSAKNYVPFDDFRKTCFTPQIRAFNDKKVQFQNRMIKSPEKSKNVSPSPKKDDQKQKTYSNNSKYIVGEERERSSVQIIRQKMGHYYGLVSGRRKTTGLSPKSNKKTQLVNQDEDEVARQQNPFY